MRHSNSPILAEGPSADRRATAVLGDPQSPWEKKRQEIESAQARVKIKREVARLNAAAPALLSSLKEVLACLADWMEIAEKRDQRERDFKALARARELIFYVEGKS
jgi:hypothetical protein